MSKLSKFLKVGDILVESADKPRVVLSLTPYEYKGREFFYVEAQELFGMEIIRFGVAQTNTISCLDPDEASRLHEIHEKGGPRDPRVKMAKLREESKKPEAVIDMDLSDYEYMNVLGRLICEGDILVHENGMVFGEVKNVVLVKSAQVCRLTVRRFIDDTEIEITVHERDAINVYRKEVVSVTEGRRFLTINVHDIRVGDVVADVDETPAGEVTEVVRGGQYLGHIFRYRSYKDNELHQEHRPKGTEINVYREMR